MTVALPRDSVGWDVGIPVRGRIGECESEILDWSRESESDFLAGAPHRGLKDVEHLPRQAGSQNRCVQTLQIAAPARRIADERGRHFIGEVITVATGECNSSTKGRALAVVVAHFEVRLENRHFRVTN